MDAETGRISGYVDGVEAIRQAVYKVLKTERFMHAAYSANYGAELEDKFGTPTGYALPEIKRCITEALTWDSRINSVDNFEFDVRGNGVHVSFTVHSIYGDLAGETEVVI
ncbi:MAG: DUF2634 domain-containing protein [Clostridia bacterium]|nr:DUF2634 domain-containing protein [Clostridia bacterium]